MWITEAPTAIEISIIIASFGGVWTIYTHIRNLTEERRKETKSLEEKINNLQIVLNRDYMTIERFEILETRIYEGMSSVQQRLDDVLKSLVDR